ncbi:MAG: hypothetical protein PHI63_03065 [Patescibacteria group bacterium]|nr:hypothetical protein [Patescibacteria group bacterium]
MQPLSYYLNLGYLLNLHPDPLGPAGQRLLPAVAVVAILLSIAARSHAARTSDPISRHAYRQLALPLMTMGILLLPYTGVAWLGVPVLSSRLLLAAWTAITVAWVATVAWKEWKTQPQKREERQRRLQIEKYLPK